jgi:hypothetical protein
MKLYSTKEATLPNTPDDCWVIIDSKVRAPSLIHLSVGS